MGFGGASGEIEGVQIFKNGGVGDLGPTGGHKVGTAASSLKAERWVWVTIARKSGSLKTYVNGDQPRTCAELCASARIQKCTIRTLTVT